MATEKLLGAIELAKGLGAASIYLITGGRGMLSWEGAAERFADLLRPCAERARAAGLKLLVENASPFNADIHFVHTLTDAVVLAESVGVGICIELHACWAEGGLASLINQAVPMTGLVQVSDYVLGDRSAPCRAVPGDGVIPLEEILTVLLAAGYEGVFDLELVGPRIEGEGARSATTRGAQYLSDVLTRLGT